MIHVGTALFGLVPCQFHSSIIHLLIRPQNIDQNGRRIALLGSIDEKQGILIAERAAFATESLEILKAFHAAIARVNNLGDNDIYRWYLAASGGSGNDGDENNNDQGQDLKLSLIWPCTEQHIKKYSDQLLRMVTETPEVYREHIQPYMSAKREEGRLNWVFNILEGRTEQEDVILRDQGHDGNSDLGFLVLPDLNWDRKTMGSLHLLALVQRRDIWSLRDLTKKHVPWLRYLQTRIFEAIVETYPALEADQLKLYVHCKCDLPFSVLRSLVHELIFYPRPTYLLPLPHPYRQRHARSWQYASYWEGLWVGEPHFSIGDYVW